MALGLDQFGLTWHCRNDWIVLIGWDEVDVVFVSGDAYVDHPSFAAALLGRVLEAEGFRVAILAQPAWLDADAFKHIGRPRLCVAVSAGNMAIPITAMAMVQVPRFISPIEPHRC